MHVWSEATAGKTATDAYKDDAMTTVYNDATDGVTTGRAGIVAVPGGTTYKVPLTVVQAQSACSCPSETTCAITWKYF